MPGLEWSRISLRHRLNLLFGALLLLWLTVDVGRILLDAGPRARAEDESVTRLASEFVAAVLPRVKEAPEPERALAALVGSLQNLRHVRVLLGPTDDTTFVASSVSASDVRSSTPDWFRAIADAPLNVSAIPVVIGDRRLGSIFIVADPTDEIDEVWSAAQVQLVAGGALALVILIASSLFIRAALRPLTLIGLVLARLESGDYGARADLAGSPEFVDTCRKINSLAGALSDFRADNARLIERLFDAQDEERKAIAHELHDETAPLLFGLRAKAAALAALLRANGDQDAESAAISLSDQVLALQRHNRRILERLRPAALEEFGLLAALQILIDQWRRAEPAITLTLSASARIAELGERASLMAYRFVQEALTNAFRHSGAARIDVTLDYPPTGEVASVGDSALAGLLIRIRDDGRGLANEATPSMGLLGMRERVRALGGVVDMCQPPDGGTIVEATFGPNI
jgi:two-component system, NarL family, sensor histidine kinase UhpB